jgi:hypothetical protein
MARCEVIQIQCDRCKRVELRPPQPPKATPDLELVFMGKRLKYEDICSTCKEVLARHVGYIEEWEREIKQAFGPTVHSNTAPPLTTPPIYSPAQPHAAPANVAVGGRK